MCVSSIILFVSQRTVNNRVERVVGYLEAERPNFVNTRTRNKASLSRFLFNDQVPFSSVIHLQLGNMMLIPTVLMVIVHYAVTDHLR